MWLCVLVVDKKFGGRAEERMAGRKSFSLETPANKFGETRIATLRYFQESEDDMKVLPLLVPNCKTPIVTNIKTSLIINQRPRNA